MEEPNFDEELKKIAEALGSYTGNELTRYTPFSRLMVEEKINILADAVVVLIAKILQLSKK